MGSASGVATASMPLVLRKIAYDGSALYRGDAVKDLATGYVGPYTASAGLCPFGIFWGCEYLSASQGRRIWATYWPGSDVASTQTVDAYIIPCQGAPDQLFAVQTRTTYASFADIGVNVDIYAGSGSATGGVGRSGHVIDISTATAAATFPFKIKGLYSQIAASGINGTDDTSNYNIILVSPNAGNDVGVA